MINIAKKFKVALDSNGQLAYGLDIVGNKKFTGTYELGAIGQIPLHTSDQYAILIGSPGAFFQVSFDGTFAGIQSVTVAGSPVTLTQTDDTLGISLIDLRPWKSANHTDLFIKALAAMTLTVHIYSGVR